MAKGLVSDTNLTAIANAIRSKNGSSDTYTPATMATAISNIPTSQVDETTALQYMLNNKTNYTGIAAGLGNLTAIPTFTQPDGVKVFTGAFYGCTSLLDASSIDVSDGNEFENMFRGCSSLTTLPTFPQSTGSSTYSGKRAGMFYGCTSLTSAPSMDYAWFTDVNSMFRGCKNISTVTIRKSTSASTTLKFTSCSAMFYGCTSLSTVVLDFNGTGTHADSCTDLSSMFYNCSALTSISATSNVGTSAVQKASNLFRNCSNLESIDSNSSSFFNGMLSFPTRFTLTDTSNAFNGCTKIPDSVVTKILAGNYLKNVTNASNMYKNCQTITKIGWGPDNSSNLINVNGMCSGCTNLTTVNVLTLTSLKNGGVSNPHENMFANCPSLSETSLNNILETFLNALLPNSATKTLKKIGLSSTQATTCTTLSNWAALSAAGWTTGY